MEEANLVDEYIKNHGYIDEGTFERLDDTDFWIKMANEKDKKRKYDNIKKCICVGGMIVILAGLIYMIKKGT